MTATPVAPKPTTRAISRRGLLIFLVAAAAVIIAAVVGIRGLAASPIVSVAADGTATLQGTWEPYSCDAHLCQDTSRRVAAACSSSWPPAVPIRNERPPSPSRVASTLHSVVGPTAPPPARPESLGARLPASGDAVLQRVPHQAQPHEQAADRDAQRHGREDHHEEWSPRPGPDEELDRCRPRVLRAEHRENNGGHDHGGDDQPCQVGDVGRDRLMAGDIPLVAGSAGSLAFEEPVGSGRHAHRSTVQSRTAARRRCRTARPIKRKTAGTLCPGRSGSNDRR